MNSKVYLNSIIVIAVIVSLVALFGASNHFMGYYDPKGTIAKNSNSKNNNDDPKPTPNPNPNPNPNPDPTPTDKELYGYKCKYDTCSLLAGTNIINNKYVFIVDGVKLWYIYFNISNPEYNFIPVLKSFISLIEINSIFPMEYCSIPDELILNKFSSLFLINI